MSGSDDYGSQRWVSFYNDSNEEIPSYAVLMLVSDKGETETTVNYLRRLRAKQYTDDVSDGQFYENGLFALNSRVPVEAGKYGKCTFAFDGPAYARVTETDLSPHIDIMGDHNWVGMEFGPFSGKWGLQNRGTGFVLMARPDLENDRVLVLQRYPEIVMLQYDPAATKVLGPRGRGGIEVEGDAFLAINQFGPAFRDNAVTLSARDLNGLILPGQFVRARRTMKHPTNPAKPIYYAFSGGFTSFRGVTAEEGDVVDVDITGTSANPLTSVDPVKCKTLFGEYLPEGTSVFVVMSDIYRYIAANEIDDDEVMLWITNYACSEIDA